MAYKGRARSHETQRIGHESDTTPDAPHTDDEMDNVATGKGELDKLSGLPINASHGPEMSNRDAYELDDLRTSKVKPLQEPINDIWKDEMIYVLLLAAFFATILASFIVAYVVGRSQASNIVTDVLWFTSLSFTLAAASVSASIC